MSDLGRFKQIGMASRDFVVNHSKIGLKKASTAIEKFNDSVKNTAFMLAPAFIGLQQINPESHSVLPNIVTFLIGGGAGYFVSKDREIQAPGTIAVLSVLGGIAINMLAGFKPDLNSLIIDGSIGVAVGSLGAIYQTTRGGEK